MRFKVRKWLCLVLTLFLCMAGVSGLTTKEASAKSVDEYEWSDEQLPIFVACYSDGDSEYLGTVFLEKHDNWGLRLYQYSNFYETLRNNLDNNVDTGLTFNEHLGLTKYFLGTYKMVLQWGDKFAPVTEKGIGSWGSLDSSLNSAEVISKEEVPFDFNYSGSKTYEEYSKSVETSKFLIFDKDNNAMFQVNLSDFGDAAIENFEVDDYVAERENGKSTVSAKVVGKGSNSGFNDEVTWKFNKSDVYLKDLTISELKHKLVSGDNKTSSGSCVYEYTGLDYNAGRLDYVAIDSEGQLYYGDVIVSGIFDKDASGEVDAVIGEEDKSEVEMVRPKVTVKGIPKKVAVGDSFKVLLSTDVSATMSLNGMSNGGYHKSNKFDITSNGTYTYRAVSKSGGITEGTFEVKCFKGQS